MMTDTTFTVLMLIGSVIILVLAIYAGKLLIQVKRQQLAKETLHAQHQLKLTEHDNKIYSSVIIIVRAMKEEQCDISEGCWRLSVLLESLKLTNDMPKQFPAIFELYESIKHLSILSERKQLPKQQRMQQDVERMKVEARLIDKIRAELDPLHILASQHKNSSH